MGNAEVRAKKQKQQADIVLAVVTKGKAETTRLPRIVGGFYCEALQYGAKGDTGLTGRPSLWRTLTL